MADLRIAVGMLRERLNLVFYAVCVLDLVTLFLAFSASDDGSKGTVVWDPEKKYTYCVYDSDRATWLGVGASLLLLANRIWTMVESRCFCCCSEEYRNHPIFSTGWGWCFVILYWAFFILAEACLLVVSFRNAYLTRYRYLFFSAPPSCGEVRKVFFIAGANFGALTACQSAAFLRWQVVRNRPERFRGPGPLARSLLE